LMSMSLFNARELLMNISLDTPNEVRERITASVFPIGTEHGEASGLNGQDVGRPHESPGTLIGRDRDIGAVDALLATVREEGASLLVRGEMGVGKSVLLALARDHAEDSGMRVLAISGAPPEAQVAFAGLHQMLRPLLGRVVGLPRPQRDALLATFGLASFGMDKSSAPGRLLIALATLALLGKEADEAPLIVIIDDAHWLDSSSAEVLGLVARRLASIPVALLISIRDGYKTTLAGSCLPELRIGPLDERSSGELVDSVAPRLDNALRGRVLAAAAGNPLALVELTTVIRSRPPGLLIAPTSLPLTARLERAFLDRYSHLPVSTRSALLVASVDEHASLNEVLAAATLQNQDIPVSMDDLAPALASGLLVHDGKNIRFWHPLVPIAIYQAATPAQRHQAHNALAATLVERPDRQVWHLAVSATGPDEELATELERASLGTMTRFTAGFTLAAAERAAELTPAKSRRSQRFLRAAELAVEFGHIDKASQLLGEIDPSSCEPQDRARIALVRDMTEPGLLADPNTVELLVDYAARASSEGAVDLALRLLQAAGLRLLWAEPGRAARSRVIAAAQQVPAPEGDPRTLSILAICDPTKSAALLTEVASRTAPGTCDANTAFLLGTALHATGTYQLSAMFLTVAIDSLRHRGELRLLSQALTVRAWEALYTANWDIATSAAEEAASLARETRQPLWEAAAVTARSLVAAVRGEDGPAEYLLGLAESIAVPLGASAVLSDVQLVRALLALGKGRYQEAFEHLQRTFDPDDPAHHHIRSAWRMGEYAEAAAHAGRGADASEQLDELDCLARTSASPRLQIALSYARPLLSDDDGAEAHFRAGLGAGSARWPFYRARLLLEYGAWLRHRRKFTESRMPLRTALDTFVALGATPWAERARQELRAARETRRQQPEAWTTLSEQEQQVADLVAQGLSNREIAQRLYISHRTVGAHLYRVFPKLGVVSRAQLQTLIATRAAAAIAS
jgi:DNA-binding CsgD family transcriptional regulator